MSEVKWKKTPSRWLSERVLVVELKRASASAWGEQQFSGHMELLFCGGEGDLIWRHIWVFLESFSRQVTSRRNETRFFYITLIVR